MVDNNILSKDRRRTFDSPPAFNKDEQLAMFFISPVVRKVIKNMTPLLKVAYVLQRGYFQAKGRFFPIEQARAKDKSLVEKLLGLKHGVDLSGYPSSTNSRHRLKILAEFGWRSYGMDESKHLEQQSLILVDKQEFKEDILFALLNYCWRNKIEIPSYTQLAGIISDSFAEFEKRALRSFEEIVTTDQTDLFDKIINAKEDVNIIASYKIDQSEATHSLNINAEIIKTLRRYHSEFRPIIDHMNLSTEADKHFSSWIYLAPIAQIRKLKNESLLNLRVKCYIKDQYYLRQDYALDAILKAMKSYENKARKHEQQEKDKVEPEIIEFTGKLVDYAKSADAIIHVIYDINQDNTLQLSEKNERTLQLIESYLIASDDGLVNGCEKLGNLNDDKKSQVGYFEKLSVFSRSIHLKLAPFIKCLEFDEENSSKHIIEAIDYFKRNDGKIENDAPVQFLNKNEKDALYRVKVAKVPASIEEVVPVPDETGPVLPVERQINRSLYKTLFFLSVAKAIKSRTLTLLFSYRYKANNRYLIPKDVWDKNRSDFIAAAGLEKYQDVEQVLKDLKENLKQSYAKINSNIINGNNSHLKFINGSWNIKTPKTDFDTSKFISSFLNETKYISLSQVIREIDAYTNFSDKFVHPYLKKSEVPVSKNILHAVITSLGCNLGHRRMSGACPEVSENRLIHAEEWLFSLKNIKNANDSVVKVIQSLSLPTVFLADQNTVHTSSDGKKVVVAVDSLLANYSFKYYGREKGVTVNSFIDEKQSLFHVNVLTSSDREAAQMIDGLVNNKIISDDQHLHSSDTHGYTEATFAGLHFINVSYAPRIKNSGKQALYGFAKKDQKKKNNIEIAPTATIVQKRITGAWDDMLRLMATIILHRCSAGLVFKQLAATGSNSDLYLGLKEFGRILKSKYLLEFYDDVEFRQKIQKQLNRVELGQKFQEAVFFGRKGKFQVGDETSILKAVHCSTLIRNCIILWNYLILSDSLIDATPLEREQIIDSISSGSVLSWSHINMLGEYHFTGRIKSLIKSSIEKLLALNI